LFLRGFGQCPRNRAVFDLGDRAAFIANEELHVVMVVMSIAARDECIQLLDLVDQPILDQEIKRAIYGWRYRRFTNFLQLVEQLVSC